MSIQFSPKHFVNYAKRILAGTHVIKVEILHFLRSLS